MDLPCRPVRAGRCADLAVHVGEFCGFWSHVLCEGTGRPKTPFPDPPDGDDVGLVGGRPLRRPPGRWSSMPPRPTPRCGPGSTPTTRPASSPVAVPTSWLCTASTPRPRAAILYAHRLRAGRRRHRRGARRPGHQPRTHRAAGPGRTMTLPVDRHRHRLGGDHRHRTASTVERRHPGRSPPRAAATWSSSGDRLRPRAHPVPPPDAEPGRRARRLHRPRGVAPRVHVLTRRPDADAGGRPAVGDVSARWLSAVRAGSARRRSARPARRG